ncbi:MAG: SpoIIE family protein phosphatase [Nitrospirota bacterium]|nr:SpoIIE family protein phosphatase [Nitrospirota bacterium]
MEEKRTLTAAEEHLKNMEQKVEDLRMLMDVSAIISSTLDFKELISLVMEKAKEVMHADACSILVYNKKTDRLEFEVALSSDEASGDILKEHVTLGLGEGIAGWVAQNLEPIIVGQAAEDNRHSSQADSITGFTTKSMIAVPLVGRSGLIGVAEILNPLGRDQFSDYDLEIFQALCRQIAVAMENAVFHQESLEKERLKQELELAATIQRSFLPPLPIYEKGILRVLGFTLPARHVGGDLYDFEEPVEGQVGVLIGDISGKGVSAALFMAKAISDFRYQMRGNDDPGLVMSSLNQQMANSPRGMFLTAMYAIADMQTGRVKISVAGHPPFLWVTADDVKVMDLEGGPPVGIMEIDYPVNELTLAPGDRLIMVTDGVFDAKNSAGNRLGFEEIVAFATRNRQEDQLTDLIVDFVGSFTGDAERADDLTIVELRRVA